EREDDKRKGDDLRIGRAEQRGDQRFGDAIDQASQHHTQALSIPPRIATAKALMPNSVPMVEEMVKSGATRMPAMPASKPEIANAISITRSTRMPISRAASLFCTTASSALPWREVANSTCKPAASSKPITGMRICRY